ADHLAGFGHHPHAPFADRLFGEVLLVGPGPTTGLSAAAEIEGDTVDTAPVVHPFVIDALLEATWHIDGGVGVEAVSPQFGLAHLARAVAGLARGAIEAGGHRDIGQPQRGGRYPGTAHP